jgi:hypothetical protein
MSTRRSDDLSRRCFLGASAALGLGALAARFGFGPAHAGEAVVTVPKAERCIVLWMNGGPAQLDTFDPKSKTRAAGPFADRATRAPGVRISELLPQIAEQMHHVALVRGLVGTEGNHERARALAHTGHAPNPTVDAPSLGAWFTKRRPRPELALPPFVSLGGPGSGGGFFGSAFDPFVVQTPGELPEDLAPLRPVGEARGQRRLALLGDLDRSSATRIDDPGMVSRAALRERALAMMSSDLTRAFAVEHEPASVRRAYGDTPFGRGCLAARRLVEVGVPFIEVTQDGWDTHEDGFDRTRRLCAELDPAMASLLADLAARGLLASTLVLWMGEFGRTPRINGAEGRDHHPAAFSAALAGGGIRGGMVHGETDADAARVVRDAVSVPDLLATLGARLGVDPGLVEWTPAGRPISPTEGGTPIAALLGA